MPQRIARSLFTVLVLLHAAMSSGGPAAQSAPAPSPEAVPAVPVAPRLPFYLRGIDLAQPSQHAFKGWPPPELIERPYWMPWGWMTFQRAQLFSQPVVLVLSNPWNRSAQRAMSETFGDKRVLSQMNGGFLSLLVSADRRPDLRERYGSATWPTVVLLLPDGKPMISQANPSGVALPISVGLVKPDAMLFVLDQGRLYFDKWSKVLQGVAEVYEKKVLEDDLKPGAVKETASDAVARWLVGNVDAANGGFGAFPKFLAPGVVELASIREDRMVPALVDPARESLRKLVASPLHDDRDGGFHRMAAAAGFKEIQYEKMLEGNVDWIRELAYALRRGADPEFRAALADTSRFVTSVLARPGGGFYQAQIADSRSDDGGAYWNAESHAAIEPPPVDKLVLSGPNALAGAALLRAGYALDDRALEDAGRAAIDLVLARAYTRGRGVLHVIEPQPEEHRFLVSQADVAFAFIDAYETTGDPRLLDAAKDLVDFAVRNLQAPGESALRDFLPIGPVQGLLKLPKRIVTDNARIARVMLRLAALGQGAEYRDGAYRILSAFAGDLVAYHTKAVEPALAIEEAVREPVVLTVDGNPSDPKTAAWRRAALRVPRVWTVVRTGDSGAPPGLSIAFGGRSAPATRPETLADEISRRVAQDAP